MKKAWSLINCVLQHSKFPMMAGALLAVMPMLAGASSISLPAATYSGMVEAGVSNPQTKYVTGPGTYSVSDSGNGASASSTMTISSQPFPSVSLVSTATTGPNDSGGAQGNPYGNTAAPYQIAYSIEFLGPQGTVPVQINATLAASVSNSNAFAFADSYFNVFLGTPSHPEIEDYVVIQYGDAPPPNQEIAGVSQLLTADPNTGAYSGGGTDSQVWLAQTNTIYTVALSAYTATLGNTQVAASVDPTFQIASSVTDPADYSIAISDGIGDSAETTSIAPEPTTATLALCGAFATVCGVFRRRMKARGRSC